MFLGCDINETADDLGYRPVGRQMGHRIAQNPFAVCLQWAQHPSYHATHGKLGCDGPRRGMLLGRKGRAILTDDIPGWSEYGVPRELVAG